jgi:triosephosphate isomerase (TIM)
MKSSDVKEFIQEVSKHHNELKATNTIYGIAPVSLHLDMAKKLGFEGLNVVAQNCYFESNGAYTGEVSVSQLHDLEIKHVIVGHSERRVIFHESDLLINKKVLSLVNNDITAILCVGESLEQYESSDTNKVVKHQVTEGLKSVSEQELDNVIIAYEPV